ncbi:MAG: hypothetical protein KGI25_08065 [Thaumarchaeota archaeon]|nr:hypothetical protein [Nitrososphaerota archaeon]
MSGVVSTDYFEGALTACHNAINLKDSAHQLCSSRNAHHGLFLLYTAREELEKAVFCLFAHYGHVTPQQIDIVFRSHAARFFSLIESIAQ